MRTLQSLFLLTWFATACGGAVDPAESGDLRGGGPTSAAVDPNDVWLTFSGAGRGPSSIYAMRKDGTSLHKLHLDTPAAEPAFSADGRFLAYASPSGIFVKNLRGGTSKRITTGPDSVPAWSPDGKWIAFARDLDIWVVGSDGRGARSLVQGPPPGQGWYSNYGHPAFTSDGGIVFGRRGALERINLDGSAKAVLVETGNITHVGVSFDGTKLAFGANCDNHLGPTTLIAVPVTLAASGCQEGNRIGAWPMSLAARTSWSTTGLIAYASSDYTIEVVPASGGAAIQVLDSRISLHGEYIGEVAWSRPGSPLP